MVGDVAGALVRVTQFSGPPTVFAIVAGGHQRGPLQAHVFAAGNIRSRRQNITHFTVENTVHVDHALRAAIRVMQGGGSFTSINALADGVERGAFHPNVSTALRVRARRLRGSMALMAFTARAFQAAIFVHNV